MKKSKDIEKSIIAECTIQGKKVIITSDKKIYEKSENGNYIECLDNNHEINLLRKYAQPPKSLDIDR